MWCGDMGSIRDAAELLMNLAAIPTGSTSRPTPENITWPAKSISTTQFSTNCGALSTSQHKQSESLLSRMENSEGGSSAVDNNNFEHEDLPGILVIKGWTKQWSQKQKRPYFYNRLTKESRWEYPEVAYGTDDPLGIKSLGVGVEGNEDQSTVRQGRNSVDQAVPGKPSGPMKRRLSSTDGLEGLTSAKKPFPLVNVNYNLMAPSNVVIELREPLTIPPPHPETELLRAHLMRDARASFAHNLQTREGIAPPINAYNRALLAHKVRDQGSDPMLPTQCDPELCISLFREVMNDIPVRIVKPTHSGEARKVLFKYSEAARQIMDTRSVSRESRKMVKWQADDTIRWLRQKHGARYEEYLERLRHLKQQCQPHLTEAVRPSVEGICLKWYNSCCEVARKVAQRSSQLLEEQMVEVPALPEFVPRKVECYPVHLITPLPNLPPIDFNKAIEFTTLTYKEESVRVNNMHFYKLEQLYRMSCHDDPKMSMFLSRVWCLLKRYETSYGTSAEGYGMQAALAGPIFECLHRMFGVSFECFASPLNCYFKQYCSAFADTDGFFGSRGPILNFHPKSGSFEANPPFCEELMEAMVDHFESLLSETQDPLSFVVCIPEWRDPPTEALIRLESSRYNRKQVLLPAREHEYRMGLQHNCNQNEVNVKSMHGTLMVFLQNEAGFNKWTPTPEKLKELILAAKPRDV